MSEHTPTPWTIYDESDPHHIKVKGIRPDVGGAHVASVLFPENASFLLKAVNNHDALVKALLLARKRIEYLGAACNAPRHFEANAITFLPAIDEVLGAVGSPPHD